MQTQISANYLQKNTIDILNQVNQSHQPITISGDASDCVILAKSDWSAICETLYLNSIPNMSKSIKKGLDTDINNCILGIF